MTVDPLFFRGLERLLVVLIAGLCLWIAYRIGSGRETSSGSVQWESFSIELKKIGPNIFFGAFGTAILIYSLLSPFSLESTISRQPDGSETEQRRIVFLSAQDQERSRKALSSISANISELNGYIRVLSTGSITGGEREELASVIRKLISQREELFTAAFGSESRVRYEDYTRRCSDPAELESADCVRRREEIGIELLETMGEF